MTKLAKKLKNEIYMISPHGSCAARRSPREIDIEELKAVIADFGKSPNKNILFSTYKGEPLFISLHLCHSSGFLIAAVPYCRVEAVLGYISYSGCSDILVSDGLMRETAAQRIPQEELDAISETLFLMRMPSSAVGTLPRASAFELIRKVSACVESISELVGCTFNVIPSMIVNECENFDICFFEAFAFCLSMLVRRAAVDRSADISFFMTKTGLAVRAEFECFPDTATYELDEIKAFAEANNMYFSLSRKKNCISVEVSPHRPDISKLGLKNNDIFLE